MLHVDVKFARLLGPRLVRFKEVKPNHFNFRCPICGDSHTSKSKARGNIYQKKMSLFYKCFNCQASLSLGNFIKSIDENLYAEYVLERYKESTSKFTPHAKAEEALPEILKIQPAVKRDVLKGTIPVNTLPDNHPVCKYLEGRKIPKAQWSLLFVAPKFKSFVNGVKHTFKDTENDHPRLIIPFYDKGGNIFAFQGRAFGNEKPKYYTVKIDEDADKIFGLERLNSQDHVYITEGPIDSLFLPNAIACAGASFDADIIRKLKDNATIVIDNEPRNKEIVGQIEKYIEYGFSIALLPDSIKEKDINDMVKAGRTIDQIKSLIDENTFSGLTAKLKFASWKKV